MHRPACQFGRLLRFEAGLILKRKKFASFAMTTTVAIHQPNFLPWLGFFDKWAKSDILILLDDVQFPKTGGVWTNRSRIVEQGKPAWLTVPINRTYSGVVNINQIQVSPDNSWKKKMISRLSHTYGKHPFFTQVSPMIFSSIELADSLLSPFNVSTILSIGEELGLSTNQVVLSSALKHEGNGTELLCSLTSSIGADTYFAGGGATGYQEDSLFEEHGIHLKYQNFVPPTHSQVGLKEFVPGLSVIDALMNIGFEGSRKLLGINSQQSKRQSK